ncbi:hypothetical protein [Gibbsiella quercinecans]
MKTPYAFNAGTALSSGDALRHNCRKEKKAQKLRLEGSTVMAGIRASALR